MFLRLQLFGKSKFLLKFMDEGVFCLTSGCHRCDELVSVALVVLEGVYEVSF